MGSWDISLKMKEMNETFNERYIGFSHDVNTTVLCLAKYKNVVYNKDMNFYA